ncbi:MAG: L-2-amino-thiazoline-4-carboxylic acid hydrolase [Gemmatimonadaceae bacterium]
MTLPTDAELNAIGVLKRRLIEARVIAPLVKAFAEEFGSEQVHDIARRVIGEIARAQGSDLARATEGNSLPQFAATLDRWTADDALHIETRESSSEAFAFDVTRCRYAEMYREMGIPELGAILSCNRDGALIEGFNPNVELTRTQTLMGGASHCDFRYKLRRTEANEPSMLENSVVRLTST